MGNNSKCCKNPDLLRFVTGLIKCSQCLEMFQQEKILTVTFGSHEPHIIWHGVCLGEPDWGMDSHALAFSLRHPQAGEYLHIILNAYWEPLEFEIPPVGKDEAWHRIVDTSLNSPDDFYPLETAPIFSKKLYAVEARSAVVLMAGNK